jgi:hypothetical protein
MDKEKAPKNFPALRRRALDGGAFVAGWLLDAEGNRQSPVWGFPRWPSHGAIFGGTLKAGWGLGALLAGWLNNNEGTAGYRETVSLWEDLREFALHRERRLAILQRVNPALSRHALYPQLVCDSNQSPSGWNVVWQSRSKSSGGWAFGIATRQGRAHVLLTLLVGGKIHWLRRCRQCQKWFFARRERNLDCSKLCGNGYRRSTPEGAEKHRTDMKTYYRKFLSANSLDSFNGNLKAWRRYWEARDERLRRTKATLKRKRR